MSFAMTTNSTDFKPMSNDPEISFLAGMQRLLINISRLCPVEEEDFFGIAFRGLELCSCILELSLQFRINNPLQPCNLLLRYILRKHLLDTFQMFHHLRGQVI